MISQMRAEIDEIPEAAERLLASDIAPVVSAFQAAAPPFLISVARGSSDHACTYLKYACELLLARPVASVGPSVASIYGTQLSVPGAVCLSVSQSGASPDIVEMTRSAGAGGAQTIALTNDVGSELARVARHVIDIKAGPERSVAATKSFLNSALAGLWLLAEVAEDAALLSAIRALPEALAKAIALDWSAIASEIGSGSVYVLGRGPSWAMAEEAALKFKEVAQVHAESYSSAEVLHGPVSILDRGFPVLALASGDAAEEAVVDVADTLAGKGASVFATTPKVSVATPLPVIRTAHPLTDPLVLIASFYAVIEAMARARGLDPDAPRHLHKVTETR